MVTTFHQSSENDFFKYKTHQLQKKSTNEQFYINPAKNTKLATSTKKRKKTTHNKDQQILKTDQASVWF